MPRAGGFWPGARLRGGASLTSNFGSSVACAFAILAARLVAARFVVFGMELSYSLLTYLHGQHVPMYILRAIIIVSPFSVKYFTSQIRCQQTVVESYKCIV